MVTSPNEMVAEAIARSPEIAGARNRTLNIGGDEQMSVRELASRVAEVMHVADNVEFLPPRREVLHAHCDHALARSVFSDIYAEHSKTILAGLRSMSVSVRKRPVPPATRAPSAIEIADRLPPSWAPRD